MIDLILEAAKDIAIMIGASVGLNLILRSKIIIPFEKKHIPWLPLTVAIEEGLFRVAPFFLLGLLNINPWITLGVSSSLFALIHLPNLKGIKHTKSDITKYLTNVAVLGGILGYIYMQQGFLFTYTIHLLYDFIVIGWLLLAEKHGRNIK